MYICVIILRHICLPACLHYSLRAPCHSLSIEPWLLWHWPIVPSSDLSGGPAVNSSQVFGLRAAWAWHALCFWTGVSVFVPDRELEIRGRHFCTCIPFTFHLVPLTIALPLQLSDTLVMLSLHALNCSCSRGDFFLFFFFSINVRGKIHWDKTERHHPADLYDHSECGCQGEAVPCKQEVRNQNLSVRFNLSPSTDPVQGNLNSVLLDLLFLFVPLVGNWLKPYRSGRVGKWEDDLCSLRTATW